MAFNLEFEGEVACDCGRIWLLTSHKLTQRDDDSIECKCGKTLKMEWSALLDGGLGTRHQKYRASAHRPYTDVELRRSFNGMRQHLTGPSPFLHLGVPDRVRHGLIATATNRQRHCVNSQFRNAPLLEKKITA